MPRPPSRYPTDLELEILKILWREGPLTVREVQKALAETRRLAYTSVMTVMTIMTEKEYLRRVKRGRSFVYRARITEKATTKRILRDLVDRVFSGSSVAAMLKLLETADLNEEELTELRQLIGRKGREESP